MIDREALSAAFDTIDAAVDELVGYDAGALVPREQLAILERCEKVRRRLPAIEHPLINSLGRDATQEELGGPLSHAIAEATLISRAEAGRRIKAAHDLGPRHALTGEPMAPVLAPTAAAQRDGTLGGAQVAVISRFCHQLPGWVDVKTREQVEARLAKEGSRFRRNSSPSWPTRSPTASTPTATTATRTAPGSAA